MSKTYVDIEAVKEVLADVKDCEDKVYALALLEWAVDKRTVSEEEIRADERKKVLHEQRALDVNLQICAEEVRADERRKFAIWLDENGYMRKMDLNISRVDEALYEYEKEMEECVKKI